MGSETRDRFLKLERPREAAPGRVDPLANDDRFERVGDDPPAHAPAPPRAPRSATDRFRPPPERALETAELPEGAQPFTRCARCETDNTLYAPTCQSCGAALDTAEQRAFNERLWERRSAEAGEERRALAETLRERERLAGAEERGRRELAEEMARREKDRVEAELGGWSVDGGGPPPIGRRLLARLPAGWRLAALVLAGVGPLLLAAAGRGPARGAGLVLLILLVGALVPARRSRR